ncbi:MAG: DNA-directed RNA polymerase subunit alpha C-terminal domain-containing protein [Planctomycetaceae bacterium]
MKPPERIDVRDLLHGNRPFGPSDADALTRAIAGPQLSETRQEVQSLASEISASGNPAPAQLVRAGVAAYILGQHQHATEWLSRVPSDPVAAYYLALTLSATEQHAEAEKKFAEAGKIGYDAVECTLRRAGEIRAQGRLEDAEATLRSVVSEGAGRAEYSYQMGCILSDRGDTYGAVEYFERAADMDPRHSRALFRLAAENALRGNDDEAVRLYERSLSKPPYYLGALLNLGLLYEDQLNYTAAAYCFRRILEADPRHARAHLYLKDIEAASSMFYDEDSARNQARLEQLLNRPITDFELSVRSRNCLQGMNINTLGDMTHVTEQELLEGKNFGETSLREVRDLMAAHGLTIGQNLSQAQRMEPVFMPTTLSPQEQAVLSKPISDLNLSVRARKCMARLGLTTVGELMQRSADDLLSSRNFGVTSLNEVRAKLTEIGLKLRND